MPPWVAGVPTDLIYKSIPFVMTFCKGVAGGIPFLDNTWRSSFDFNKELRDAYSFGSAAGPLDYLHLSMDRRPKKPSKSGRG